MKRIAGLFLIVMISLSLEAIAAEQVITAEHTFELGENDSRNDARRMCYMEAKRKLLESVHYYLQKTAYGDDHWFDKDDINIYADLLLKIDTVDDKWHLEEGKLSVTLSLQTTIDADYIGRRMKEIRSDEELQEKIKEDRRRLQKQEEEYESIHRALSEAAGDKALMLRSKRQALSRQIDQLEEIQYLIGVKTKTAEDFIKTGMTMNEVIAVAGQPRATTSCEYPDFMNYGDIWIALRNGIVVGKIPMEKWAGACYQYEQKGPVMHPPDDGLKKKVTAEAEENKYEITLKGGQKIQTSNYERIDDVIYYKRFDGIIGVEASKVKKIEELR